MSMLQHPLFELIRSEHSIVLERAHRFFSSPENKDSTLATLQMHHRNEEVLLFSVLSTHPQICEGGPLCTYFFDEQIVSPPIERARVLTNKKPLIPQEMAAYWSSKSPIRIPISEHLALQHIIEFSDPDVLKKNQNVFYEILKSNFGKEEGCLFHVCVRLLKIEQMDEIYRAWLPQTVESQLE